MKKEAILITGASGFVGRHLIAKLNKKNKDQLIITIARNGEGKKRIKNVTTYFGNVTDWDFIESIFKKYAITICFHLASQALVDKGKESPTSTLKTNIEGTWNILEACRKYNTQKVIIASTSHVYGNNTQVPYKEYDTPRPSRIYETSKACVDIIAQSYIATYGLPVFIARFTNIYGPGDQNFSRIIPLIIKNILDGKQPEIWGGDAVRDYLFIDDAIDAYIKLASLKKQNIKNHIFNFGGGNPISAKDLAQAIIKSSGKKDLELIINKSIRRDEIKEQYVSWEKAKRKLRWKPKHTLEEGLKKTVTWYKKNYSSHEKKEK